jgi:Fe-S-cluster containining protein
MNSLTRRQILLDANRSLNEKGVDCSACAGECCTSRSNSMQVTRIEAEDIRAHLVGAGLWNEDLFARLRECVREYRLDVELPRFGSRQNLRRTYTCPFYSAGPRGCSLPREAKPYGCLAFNPVRAGAGGLTDGCLSDVDSLVRTDALSPAIGDKLPIPLALIRISDI